MNLLKSHKWLGTFFSPIEPEKKFSGKLKYSPEKGVQLTYLIDENSIPSRTEIIHGVLENGQPCSLIGDFDVRDSWGESRYGKVISKIGIWGFHYLLIGHHIVNKAKYSSVTISFLEVEELFVANKGKWEKYTKDPIIESNLEIGKLLATHNIKRISPLNFLLDDEVQLYIEDDVIKKILREAFVKIKAHDEKPSIQFKGNLNYYFKFELKCSEPIDAITNYIKVLSNLLSLIYFHPAIPQHLEVSGLEGEINFNALLFISDARDKRTIKLCKPRYIHQLMPISVKTVNFSHIIEKWFSMAEKYYVFVLNIQSQTGYVNTYELYGHIAVIAQHLEDIGLEDEQNKMKKYEYSIEKYATRKTIIKLEKLFTVKGLKKIGFKLGKLRADILHVKTGRETLNKLSLPDLANIALCLELIVASHILTMLEIEKSVVNAYQDLHSPSIY